MIQNDANVFQRIRDVFFRWVRNFLCKKNCSDHLALVVAFNFRKYERKQNVIGLRFYDSSEKSYFPTNHFAIIEPHNPSVDVFVHYVK